MRFNQFVKYERELLMMKKVRFIMIITLLISFVYCLYFNIELFNKISTEYDILPSYYYIYLARPVFFYLLGYLLVDILVVKTRISLNIISRKILIVLIIVSGFFHIYMWLNKIILQPVWLNRLLFYNFTFMLIYGACSSVIINKGKLNTISKS